MSVAIKIKRSEGQAAGFGPFHSPGQPILEFRCLEPQPNEWSWRCLRRRVSQVFFVRLGCLFSSDSGSPGLLGPIRVQKATPSICGRLLYQPEKGWFPIFQRVRWGFLPSEGMLLFSFGSRRRPERLGTETAPSWSVTLARRSGAATLWTSSFLFSPWFFVFLGELAIWRVPSSEFSHMNRLQTSCRSLFCEPAPFLGLV